MLSAAATASSAATVTTTRCWCCRAAVRSAIRRASTKRCSKRGSPDWVTGVSIGAINAALIAGNPPGGASFARILGSRLVGPSADPAAFQAFRRTQPHAGVGERHVRRSVSSRAFHPRSSRLKARRPRCRCTTFAARETLKEMINFDRSTTARCALPSAPCMCCRAIPSTSTTMPDTKIAVEHVMASGALPPGFPPVKIGKDYYWDGGLV